MTYQQAIVDAIRLFLTTDVDAATTAAVTGSGLSFFCPAAVDAAIIPTGSTDVDVAITMIIAAATTGSGSFSSSSVADVAIITGAANPVLICPMGSSYLNPLVLSGIYQMHVA